MSIIMREFVPIVSTLEGSCLTYANWQEVGIKILAYSLESLLIKPGFEFLKILSGLRDYISWPGKLVLDISSLMHQGNDIMVRSPYDGRIEHYLPHDITQLVKHLQPDIVVAQPGPSEEWVFFHDSEQLYRISHRPMYDAYHGRLYHSKETFQIQEEAQRQSVDLIDESCQCPTCRQKFTRAYLHHLLQHTPLLCQRLLIQHNVYATLKSSYDVTP